MRRHLTVTRPHLTDAAARLLAERIKTIDYELMAIVSGGPNSLRNPLTPEASRALVAMQRQLRSLRIEMEVERRFDTAPRPKERRCVAGNGR